MEILKDNRFVQERQVVSKILHYQNKAECGTVIMQHRRKGINLEVTGH